MKKIQSILGLILLLSAIFITSWSVSTQAVVAAVSCPDCASTAGCSGGTANCGEVICSDGWPKSCYYNATPRP